MNAARRRLWMACAVPLALAVAAAALLLRPDLPEAPVAFPVATGPLMRPGPVTPALSFGANNAALLAPNGEAWIWGYFPFPTWQTTNAGWERPRLLTPEACWTRLAVGGNHALLIRDDGTLWGMGINFNGQLGLPAGGVSNLVQLGDATGWVEIATGDLHGVALDRDGVIWTWGFDTAGQIGRGGGAPNVQALFDRAPIPGTNQWSMIAANAQSTFALRRDGTLWAWGQVNGTNRPTQLGSRTDWKAIHASSRSVVGLHRNGTLSHRVVPSGSPYAPDRHADLPDLDHLDDPEAAPPWDSVVAIGSGLVARRPDGSWWGWQLGDLGQSGLGHRNQLTTLTRLPWPTNTLVVAGNAGTVGAFLPDGTLWQTGLRIGANMSSPRWTPARFLHHVLVTLGSAFTGGTRSSAAVPRDLVPRKLWAGPDTPSPTSIAPVSP